MPDYIRMKALRPLVLVLAIFAAALLMKPVAAADPPLLGAGGKLAYTDPAGNLWILDGRTGMQRKLVGPPAFRAEEPAWSPDGTTLAFTARVGSEYPEQHHLYVVSETGGTPRRLVDGYAYLGWISWSPDGQRLVYVATPGSGAGGRIHSVQIDGSSNITFPWPADPDPLGSEMSPAVSPDGTIVAFAFNTTTCQQPGVPISGPCPSGIAVAAADGSSATVLAEGVAQAAPGAPSWVPDGSAIAFPLGTSIQLVTIDGTDAGQVLHAGAEVSGPIVYSRDGSAIVFFVVDRARDANAPIHLQISSAAGSPLGDAPFDGGDDKVQWIGSRVGLLAFAGDRKLMAFRPDGTASVEIPGPLWAFSYDWHP